MTRSSRTSLVVPLVLCAAVPALGQPIPVQNGDFETPALGPAGFNNVPPPGWTKLTGSTAGVFYPTVSTWNYTAPQGNQVLYLNGATVEQDLAIAAQGGQTYTLRVLVVHRPNFFQQAYEIHFMAGGSILGSDLGTLTPPLGGALESVITVTVAPGSPAIGQPLRIRLAGPSQTNFDDVRVDVGIPVTCYANCDGSTGSPKLNVADFGCFLNKFATGSAYANCDGSTGTPQLNVADFGCFLNKFAAGCP